MRRAQPVAVVVVAALGCRGDEPAPRPPPVTAADDSGVNDGLSVRPLAPRPPGGGGTPASSASGTGPSCADPVVGVWVAKTFADGQTRWHDHRLSIRRDADGELRADQTTRIWNGDADAMLPPLCPRGGAAWGVYKLADDARFVDGILHVWGVALRSSEHTCDGEVMSYNLDSFTGRVHRDGFVSRNNDGAGAVNRPYRFHRITCTPD